MAYDRKLSATDALAAGDYFSLFKQSAGDWRGAPVSLLQSYMQANLTFSGTEFTKQYSAPATGATATVLDSSANVWLIVTPLNTIATLTITLPATANCIDQQEVLVVCSQIVSALTVSGNGATAVNGAPTALTANGFFRLKYDAATTTWYRAG